MGVRKVTPLPKAQLALVLIARTAEPISYSLLFPFINTMIEELLPTTPKSSVGKYSGAVQSLFSISQVAFIYRWGKLSDRVGRKPVILAGLLGSASSLLLLGFSSSFYWLLVARVLSGACNGNSSVIRAVLGDLTDKTNEARAFSFWTVTWSLALIIGPALGGLLAAPSRQYPSSWIARVLLFQRFPYLLPCLVSCSITGLIWLLTFFYLEESLPTRKRASPGAVSQPTETDALLSGTSDDFVTTSVVSEAATTPEEPLGFLALLRISKVYHVVWSYFLIVLVSLSFEAIFPVWCYSSLPLGGLALTPAQISICLALKGGISAVVSLTLFPFLIRKFGIELLYRAFAFLFVPLCALPLIMNRLARSWDEVGWVGWASMGLLMLLYSLGDLCLPLNMMALNISSPSQSSLGALNGLNLTIGSIARSIGPGLIGWMFSLSARTRFPWVWLLYVGFAVVSWLAALRVEGRGKDERATVEDEEHLSE